MERDGMCEGMAGLLNSYFLAASFVLLHSIACNTNCDVTEDMKSREGSSDQWEWRVQARVRPRVERVEEIRGWEGERDWVACW